MWPPTDELLAAWRGLVADPDTAGAFAALVLHPLEVDLARQFRHYRHAHPDDITAAVDTAVAAFLRAPDRFDPGRKWSLPTCLRRAARCDLLNLLAAEEKHRRGRIPWDSVELTHPAGNEWEEAARLADDPVLRATIEALPDVDRRVLDLMADGERATTTFAAVMGITDRPAAEQTDLVKRAKERVMVRLKRAAGEP